MNTYRARALASSASSTRYASSASRLTRHTPLRPILSAGQLATAHQRVHLRDGDVQDTRDLGRLEQGQREFFHHSLLRGSERDVASRCVFQGTESGRSSTPAPNRRGVTALAALAQRGAAIRLPKIDTRLVVGLLLVALSVLGGLRLAATSDDTVAVLVATRDLPANHTLTSSDLGTAQIHASDAVLGGLLRAGAARPVGRVLRFPLVEGGLLGAGTLGAVASDGREITVPIGSDHALGGALEPGDRVDILGSFDKGTEIAKTLTVAAGARVVEVVHADGLFGQREGDLTALTVSVPPNDVVFVAFAVRNGEVDVVRAGGSTRGVRTRFDVSELP